MTMKSFASRSALAVVALTACVTVQAQDAASYPSKPITLVVPAPPGGGSDILGRLFADYMGRELKQSVIVENRPGANGQLGAEYVLSGPADGYRLLFSYTAAMVVAPILQKKPPFDPVKDFAAIAQIGRGGNVMMVRKDLPVNNFKEFIDYARARPGQLNYCSWGAGSGGHLAMEVLSKQAGLKMTHIPYKGVIPCTQDLIGGQVDANWSDASSSLPFIREGRLKALATSTPTRTAQLPDVPTLNEVGYPFTAYAWYGLFAPAKTPPAIVAKVNGVVRKALQDPAVVQRLGELNFNDLPLTTPEQFKSTVARDYKTWSEVIKEIGLSLD